MTENNAENSQLEKELDADPASTYGASEAYKAAWHEKFGGDADPAAPSTPNDSTPGAGDGTAQAPAAAEQVPANAGANDAPADPAEDPKKTGSNR
jgi:hypothetical protein